MTRRQKVVAILGGGFSGLALALQLRGRARVVLYEPGPVGPGLAYGTAQPAHLLNVPATGMSLFPDRPGHFAEWLGAPAGPPVFAPRATYGRYLHAQWRDAAAADPSLQHRPQAVTALTPRAGGGLLVTDAAGGQEAVDEAVLAVGGFAAGAGAPPLCWGNPWDPAALRGLAPDAPVLLVGQGLTMVDVLLALREAGHRGPVLAISRHGWWPLPHVGGAFPPPRPVELPEGEGVLALWRRVRAAARVAMAEGQPWQAVLDGVRPQVQRIWQGWPEAERARFQRHARTAWNLHRHRLAPEVAARLAEERAGGTLRGLAARLLRWEPAGEGVRATLRRRGGGEEVRDVARIILCTGPEGGQAWRQAEPLRTLLAEGRVATDGLGLATDAQGRALDAAGQPVPGLSVLGPLTRGRLWEVTAVPEIRAQAAALADRIAGGKSQNPV
ncbi:FAD/NAD(P)-binding protein [Pseudoroseomonas cervicalis]|uniref:FAD/NAD(P)-binding protein n=1 Tax=Teichococcus cervicalis TaxID=204525 RepID=UPI0022F16ACB|nr:FAD/NAD(P)-binding protein [Pseudoroseomonas cervicalis]WBV43542.1 FAD/NAD(P)-binding protein [Pseudoroseomonas cervicalis]